MSILLVKNNEKPTKRKLFIGRQLKSKHKELLNPNSNGGGAETAPPRGFIAITPRL
jgi:hypothetical protein